DVREPIDRASGKKRLEGAAELLIGSVAQHRVGDFNQALMELGALVCGARQPRCDGCPLAPWCGAYREGTALDLPRRAGARPVQPIVQVTTLVLLDRRKPDSWANGLREGRVLLVRRPR